MTYVVKLRNENYYLCEGPSGRGLGRGRKNAVKFATKQEASDAAGLCAVIGGGKLEVFCLEQFEAARARLSWRPRLPD